LTIDCHNFAAVFGISSNMITENKCVTEIEAKLPSAISVTEKESLVSVLGIRVRKIPLTLSIDYQLA